MEATPPPSPCAPGGNWEPAHGGRCSLTSPLLCFTRRQHPEARAPLGVEDPEWCSLPWPPSLRHASGPEWFLAPVPLVLASEPQAKQSP